MIGTHHATTMTSRPAPSKRQPSTSPSVPVVKPQCRIHSTAIVADKAQITGSYVVEIGENAIIHPYAKVRAEHGNVFIGKGAMVSEKAVVGVPSGGSGGESEDIVIGEGVSVESGAVVEASRIGEYATIGINAKVERGAFVGRWCKVAPLVEVGEKEVLEDFTVVFADGRRRTDRVARDRREIRESKLRGRVMEMEVFRGLVPNGSLKWNVVA